LKLDTFKFTQITESFVAIFKKIPFIIRVVEKGREVLRYYEISRLLMYWVQILGYTDIFRQNCHAVRECTKSYHVQVKNPNINILEKDTPGSLSVQLPTAVVPTLQHWLELAQPDRLAHAFQLITSEMLLGSSLFLAKKQGHLILTMKT